MIADIPPRVLALVRTDDEPTATPRPVPRSNCETMRALVAAGKAQGLASDFIADALDRRIQRYLATVGHRGEGERNATAYRVARWLLNDFGASDAVATAYVSEWNAGNTPPLSERELAMVLHSAKRSGNRPAGCAHRPRGSAA
jgi:hypothetical protein